MKQTIAIVGAAGEMGTAVAKELVTEPCHLLLIDLNAACLDHLLEELKTIAPSTDAEIVYCLLDASWEADIIILAVKACEEQITAARLREVATGKMVICIADTSDITEMDKLQRQLPYSKVIRALSASLSESPYIPIIEGKTLSSYIGLHNQSLLN